MNKRQMKRKTILFFLAIIGGFTLNAQHNLGIHMMNGLYQQSFHNPAMFPDSNIVVALPSAFVNVYHSGGSLGDLITENSAGESEIQVDEVAAKVQDENELVTNVDIHAFEFSIPVRDFSFSIGHAFRNDLVLNYDRTFVELLSDGNAQFIGQTIEFGPSIDFQSYSEIRLGVGYRFANIKVGARLKILSGIGDISPVSNNAKLTTSDDIYQIQLESDYAINSAAYLDYDVENGFDWVGEDLSAKDFITKNSGLAVDLGLSAKLGDKLTASVGINDLGSIKWSEGVKNFSSNINKTYDSIYDLVLDGDSLSVVNNFENLTEALEFKESSNEYSTSLPMKVNAAINYRITKSLSIAAASQMINYEAQNYTSFSIGGSYNFKKNFSAGVAYVSHQDSNTIGVTLMGRLGPAQIFLVTDNIITAFDPVNSQFGNVGAGFNLIF